MPWRPEADPGCSNGGWGDNCYRGLAFNIEFDLTSLGVMLPDQVIFGLAYNTQTWGYEPIGVPGPYVSLNFALVDVGPTSGVDVEPDAVFWNTATASNYTDEGAAGVGIFRRDTGWAPLTPAIRFTARAVAMDKDDCKKGGWQSLLRADGTEFENQGRCMRYVNTGR